VGLSNRSAGSELNEYEFEGPNFCVYEYAEDFANSYALSGPHCESAPIPKGEKFCPPKKESHSYYEHTPLIREKQVKVVKVGPAGTTTLVRQEISQHPSREQRQQILQNQAQIEELARKQQHQVEKQQARNDGEPLSQFQEDTLYGASPQQQKIMQRMRTQYIQRDDMICFTTKPVLSCVEGYRASSTKQIQLDFHCLPKQSPFTQQLIVESQKQVITQLVNKRVDIRQDYAVPIACIAV